MGSEPWRYACPYCGSRNLHPRINAGVRCDNNGCRKKFPEHARVDLKTEELPPEAKERQERMKKRRHKAGP